MKCSILLLSFVISDKLIDEYKHIVTKNRNTEIFMKTIHFMDIVSRNSQWGQRTKYYNFNLQQIIINRNKNILNLLYLFHFVHLFIGKIQIPELRSN